MRMSSGASKRYEKPALGPVELRAAHAQIHQDAHHRSPSLWRSTSSASCSNPPCTTVRPIPEGREPRAGGSHGVGVTVDAEHTHVGSRVEQQRRRGLRHPPCSRRSARAGRAGGAPPPPEPSPGDARTPPPRRLLAASPEPLAPAPTPAPRSTGAARDVSPSRQRLKAGGVGANNRAGRGAGDGPGAGPTVVVNAFLLCLRTVRSSKSAAVDSFEPRPPRHAR